MLTNLCSVLYICFIFYQSQLELLEVGIREVSSNEETLKKNFLELIEMRHVLTKTEAFFVDVSYVTEIILSLMLICR